MYRKNPRRFRRGFNFENLEENMKDVKIECRQIVVDALLLLANEKGVSSEIDSEKIAVETPPNPELGDIGMPLFLFAKTFRAAPAQIAKDVVQKIESNFLEKTSEIGKFCAVGPYVNVTLDKSKEVERILEKIQNEGEKFGSLNADGASFMAGERVMIFAQRRFGRIGFAYFEKSGRGSF